MLEQVLVPSTKECHIPGATLALNMMCPCTASQDGALDVFKTDACPAPTISASSEKLACLDKQSVDAATESMRIP